MAYGLYLVAEELAAGYPEAIHLCRHAYACRPVVDVMETIGGVAHLLLRCRVPRTVYLVRVHAVGEREGGVDVKIVEQREAAAQGYVVLEAVAPVFHEVGVHKPVLLRAYRVGELSGVAQRDLLIPPLVARRVLALEGVEARERNVKVGERHGDGRVAHVLVEVGCGAERQAYA